METPPAASLPDPGPGAIEFMLPPELEAHAPPEARGLRRDQVRLLVLPRWNGPALHTRFDALGEHLRPGDLLVINTSRTLPAMLQGTDETGAAVEVRLAQRRAEDRWDSLLLRERVHVGRAGMQLDFGMGLKASVLGPSPELPFLWQVLFDRCCIPLLDLIYRLGQPVRYGYVDTAFPLDVYQTVYASEPGSVEMPSAGRPFTWELLLGLRQREIGLAALTLHTGLSSSRDDRIDASHPIYAEEYEVPPETAAAVAETRRRGGRVVAVGTTVVRALETAVLAEGAVTPGKGITRLHISAAYSLRAVDGLITGMHEPQSSHLDLLSAFIAPERLKPAYLEAIRLGYLWHEFGDMNLIL
jgi:S-adenosylmethionine:tRNA ribosyltransferase-isomerase